MKEGPRFARVGASQYARDRVLDPARRLADRLEASSDHRGAQILRTLLKSHVSQRGALQSYYRQLQRTPRGDQSRARAQPAPAQ